MTALKQVKSKALTEKENKLGLNYATLKYAIKEQTKKLDLLKEEIANLFESKKQNVLFIFDSKHQGYIQKISRTMKRFDTTQFKQDNPQVYEKYLVDSSYLEFKPFIEEYETNGK
jgi:predicted phage-related endonuclease